ncbi:hypothetical protein BN434_1895 [Erwinia amylovora CFBP 2585]|nr:hypothetical protein BN434_1895 [Erwinia amylovora CFBP 2585]
MNYWFAALTSLKNGTSPWYLFCEGFTYTDHLAG